MNNEIIGDKKSFAIEYTINSIEPYLMGHYILWVSCMPIGDFAEEVMLGVPAGCLVNSLSESRKVRENSELTLDSIHAEEKYERIMTSDTDHDELMLNLDEAMEGLQ